MDARTKHFWRTLPPTSFLSVNRKEWEELHQRLNGGVPVPQERHLSYCVLVLHCAIVPRSFFLVGIKAEILHLGGSPACRECRECPKASQGPIGHPSAAEHRLRGAATAVLLRRDPCMVLIA